MNSSEIQNRLNIGKLPITLFRRKFCGNIDIIISVTKGNRAFLDIDDECTDEGGLRVTFLYETFDEMISSIEKYTAGYTDLYELDTEKETVSAEEGWKRVKENIYEHKIPFPENYRSFFIGDLYWNGLYLNEISPAASNADLESWVRRSEKKQCFP